MSFIFFSDTLVGMRKYCMDLDGKEKMIWGKREQLMRPRLIQLINDGAAFSEIEKACDEGCDVNEVFNDTSHLLLKM